MSEVLIYNLDPQADAKVKMLCRKMMIGSRTVEKADYSRTLGDLLGLDGDDRREEGDDFNEPMLYLAGLDGMLNLFLDQLRRNRIVVPLKAVMTESNLRFTSYELHRELCAEREAIARGMNAHRQP